MGRPLRLLTPATTWFVTTRCVDARFLMRPDPDMNTALGFCLARACRRYPGIQLLGFVALSNHLHLLVVDVESQLSQFMELFLGTLAKEVNALRNRRGHVFERRFSAEPVLDPWALRERWLYLVLNPVRAGLVARHEQWPGLCLHANGSTPERHTFRRFQQARYEAARRATPKGKKAPSPAQFYEERSVMVVPVPQITSTTNEVQTTSSLLAELRHWEGRIAEEKQRRRQGFLGPQRVLAQRPSDAPQQANRSPRPLCHTVILALHKQYRQLMRSLRQSYDEVSSLYRRGRFDIEFPRYTYRPPVPVMATS